MKRGRGPRDTIGGEKRFKYPLDNTSSFTVTWLPERRYPQSKSETREVVFKNLT